MAAKHPIPRKKLTLDAFAVLIQKDLKRVVNDIAAVKDDVTGVEGDVVAIRKNMATRDELKEVRDDVKRITDFMVSKNDLASTLREEIDGSEYAREVSELRARVERLEEKLGSGRARHAA